MKRIPDIITFLRIAAAVMLLFTTPFSIIFYLLYSWCGFSDILDGYLARKKGWSSDFGAKWDSFADMVFVIIMLIIHTDSYLDSYHFIRNRYCDRLQIDLADDWVCQISHIRIYTYLSE